MQAQQRSQQEPVIIADGEDIDRIAALASGQDDGFHRTTFEPIPLSELSLHLPPLDRQYRSDASDLAQDESEPFFRGHPQGAQGSPFNPSRRENEEVVDELALPLPPERPSPIAGVVRPAGRLNRRMVLVVIVLAALGVLLAFGLGKNNSAKNATAADAEAKAAETKNESALRVNHPNDAALRSPETNYTVTTSDQAATAEDQARYLGMTPAAPTTQVGTLPTSPIAYTPASSNAVRSGDSSANVRYNTPSAPAGTSVSYGTKGEYAVPMRAGQTSGVFQGTTEQVASTVQRGVDGIERMTGQKQGNTQTTTVRLPVGTRIPMTLLEPIQSGIETTVEARVDADIRDGQGTLLLRNGQKVSIPFLSSHTNGRMLNAPNQIEVQLPDGRTLAFAGSVKGPDGLVGLTGKITKTGTGSTVGRIFRGVAKAGVSAGETVIGRSGANAGISSSDIGLEDSVAERYGMSSQRAPREVVNISSGLRFSFVVVK